MRVWIFKGNSGVHGFTRAKDPGLLPAELGPWYLFSHTDLQPDQERVTIDAEQACADIDLRGYHVASPWIKVLRTA
jgi:hypothetical protein